MSEVTLQRAPAMRDVVREHIRVVALGLRPVALVATIVFGIVTILVTVDAARGHGATWFDSDEWFPIAYAAFLCPFAVWRRDSPFGAAFLWTLPVDRRRLALTRVFAGWLWLMLALTLFVAWQFVLALLVGVHSPHIVPFVSFIGATAMYLLGSALVLGVRHSLRWLLGGIALVVVGNPAIDALVASHAVATAVSAAETSWRTFSPFLQWTFIFILWLGAGLVALWAALSRHGERRRH